MSQVDVTQGGASGVTGDRRFRGYWTWFAAALFLLIPGDLATTMAAAAKYGFAAEANPFVRWLLAQGPATLILVNLLALVVAIYGFKGVISGVRQAPSPYDRYFERAVQGWLGLLLVAGLFIVSNNLAVVLLGRSLL
jgi:hypothetical protein